jgi:hypothetical protein
MKAKRPTLTQASVLLLAVALLSDWAVALPEYRTKSADIISAVEVKLICSCHFMTRGPEERCLEFAQLTKAPPQVTVDDEKQAVTSADGSKHARFVDDRYGCVLE